MSTQSDVGNYSVLRLCACFGYTRQAYYKYTPNDPCLKSQLQIKAIKVLSAARSIRPSMGCRQVYKYMDDDWPYGRMKTERMLQDMGYRVRYTRSLVKTTKPGARVFPNLILGYVVNNINKVWQSDITYYYTQDGIVNYLIFITDVYSQRIIGHGAFRNYPAEVCVKVLRVAFTTRKSDDLHDLIHHSDKGSQYGSNLYLDVLKEKNILSSMCLYSWANPYAEKTNDLIKNGYLKHWTPRNLHHLRKLLDKAVYNHNHYQQKEALGGLSPIEYEKLIENQRPNQRRQLTLKPLMEPTLKDGYIKSQVINKNKKL